MGKDKPNSIRTYGRDGFKRRAACICFKDTSETTVLLVSGSQGWKVPGGGIEPDEDYKSAALREVGEEAGVTGSILRCIGIFQNDQRRHRTIVFILIVESMAEVWEEGEQGRQRRWFPVDEAIRVLKPYKPIESSYLRFVQNSHSLLLSNNPDSDTEDSVHLHRCASDSNELGCTCGLVEAEKLSPDVTHLTIRHPADSNQSTPPSSSSSSTYGGESSS